MQYEMLTRKIIGCAMNEYNRDTHTLGISLVNMPKVWSNPKIGAIGVQTIAEFYSS
ncbi:MAG: hypothetical protein LBC85_02485 [Fibromonadaceae bacterium]|jgi:PDZ domain-containing secreted protein|nr:hypothetical protein [Fibromonadaceae bacterium]